MATSKLFSHCRLASTLLCTLICTASIAQESQSDLQVDAIVAEYWQYRLQENPLLATQSGISEFNDRLPSITPADRDRRLLSEQRFRRRIRDIDSARLSTNARVNAELLEWVLDQSIGAAELNLSRMPFNTFSGFYAAVLSASNGVPMNTVQDYEDYIARLRDVERYFSENIANMRDGIRSGFTLPKVVIENILPTIEAQLYDDPEQSSLYQPFITMSLSLIHI